MAKRLRDRHLLRRGRIEALQLHGGYGYLREYGLEKICFAICPRAPASSEGTNEIMRVIIARRILRDHLMEGIR